MKLSVIMPCYNVERTLQRALDSIFMQRVSFDYEIIIINDASTDSTLSVAKRNQNDHPEIEIIDNPINCGNARSFYNGLTAAKGDYFCVLDGDDYYTIPDKLQRQVDFLDQDVKCEYVATAHYHVTDTGDGVISVGKQNLNNSFNYASFVSAAAGYYHTATYMYRNIFRGNVLEYYNEIIYRGDTPRTTFHLMFSNKKVRILNFVGSAYSYSYTGIWSKLKITEQFDYQIHYISHHQNVVKSSYERRMLNNQKGEYEKKRRVGSDKQTEFVAIDFNASLRRIKQYSQFYNYREREFFSNGLYYSEFLDSLAASVGYIYRLYNPYTIQTHANDNNICIVAKSFNPDDSAYDKIIGLLDTYNDKTIWLITTEMGVMSKEIRQIVAKYTNLQICMFEKECSNKLQKISLAYKQISPFRTYYFIYPDEAYGGAIMQSDVCENIGILASDRGFLLGLTNPNLNNVIVTRSVNYTVLTKWLKSRVIYIPDWSIKKFEKNAYFPFKKHRALITAGYSSDHRQVKSTMPYNYIELVLRTLSLTKGKHYHYGVLDEETIEYIQNFLKEVGLPRDAFTWVEGEKNITQDCLDREVDVFIEPFPYVETQVSLSVMSAGIPIFVQNGWTRLGVSDFIYKDCLSWSKSEEFTQILSSLTSESLQIHSNKTFEYFHKYHNLEKIKQHIIDNSPYPDRDNYYICDDIICEIQDFLIIFRPIGLIDFMAEEKRRRESITNVPEITSLFKNDPDPKVRLNQRRLKKEIYRRKSMRRLQDKESKEK